MIWFLRPKILLLASLVWLAVNPDALHPKNWNNEADALHSNVDERENIGIDVDERENIGIDVDERENSGIEKEEFEENEEEAFDENEEEAFDENGDRILARAKNFLRKVGSKIPGLRKFFDMGKCPAERKGTYYLIDQHLGGMKRIENGHLITPGKGYDVKDVKGRGILLKCIKQTGKHAYQQIQGKNSYVKTGTLIKASCDHKVMGKDLYVYHGGDDVYVYKCISNKLIRQNIDGKDGRLVGKFG